MKTATVGKILGALGLVLLLTAPLTYFLTTGQAWPTAFKAGLGIVFLGLFFVTNYRNLGQFASGRSTFFFVSSAALAVVILVALTAVNYIVTKKDKTWDLTNKKIFTLAPQTRSTLKGLKEKVRAIGFIEPSNPYHEALEQLFSRYHRESPDNFDYGFKDPRKNPDLAAKYQLKEGQPTVILTRGEGNQEVHTSLNVISEQELTNALIKLNAVGEQKIYFTAGHGEWSLDSPDSAAADPNPEGLSELKQELTREGYTAQALNLAGKDEIPRDAALVVMAGARTRVGESEVQILRKYLEQGGRFIYFSDAGADPGAGFTKLLTDRGIALDTGVVADDRFAISNPYDVVSTPEFYGNHEITRLLKQMQMNIEFPKTRGLTLVRQGTLEGVKAEPVVLTSPFAWEETTPDDQPSRSTGEKTGQIPLVAASTQPTSTAEGKRYDEARLVVFGDSLILINESWGQEANRNLVLNTVGWTTNQVSKITIRPPDRDISTIDIDRAMMAKLRFFSSDLLPLSLLGVGLAIWLARRDK